MKPLAGGIKLEQTAAIKVKNGISGVISFNNYAKICVFQHQITSCTYGRQGNRQH